MTIATEIRRPLGTMIVHGFFEGDTLGDLEIARKLGAKVVEVLPNWKARPDPAGFRLLLEDHDQILWSAHGSWGTRSLRASRVDLGTVDPVLWNESLDDLKLCADWLESAGGTFLVIHPGGFSDQECQPSRTEALANGLVELADHCQGTGLVVCVENMPPGVYPGSRMSDLAAIVESINRPEIALALDTGHAHLSGGIVEQTIEAGRWLKTTHVHDNNGRQDLHWPPGLGSVDWSDWIQALDRIDYRGPIVLECIRHFRDRPESIDEALLSRLRRLTGFDR